MAADGTPLGPCLMTADTRGDEVARGDGRASLPGGVVPAHGSRAAPDGPGQSGALVAGHRAGGDGPDTLVHELARVLRALLTGRPVVDWSDAGTWATYDVATGGWSPARIAETGIDAGWLPDVQPNATPIGRILPAIAAELGLPAGPARGHRRLRHVSPHRWARRPSTRAWCRSPAARGTPGTWRSGPGWPVDLVHLGLSVFPHPGPTGLRHPLDRPQRHERRGLGA